MHIDGTFVPLGPGKILVNPKRPCITGDYKSYFTYDGQEKVSIGLCFMGNRRVLKILQYVLFEARF